MGFFTARERAALGKSAEIGVQGNVRELVRGDFAPWRLPGDNDLEGHVGSLMQRVSASRAGSPSWLPPAVVAEVELLAEWKIIDDTDRLILSELANWDEMEHVWRELKSHTPLPEPAQLRPELRD